MFVYNNFFSLFPGYACSYNSDPADVYEIGAMK